MFSRFLLYGTLNTLISLLIYFLLLKFVSYNQAFTISFLLGVCTSFLLHSKKTFKTNTKIINAIPYLLVYVSLYLIGLSSLNIIVKYIVSDYFYAGLLNIITIVPINYYINRFFFIKLKVKK